MLREVLSILVPLLLPTALYIAWVWLAQRLAGGGSVPWSAVPWPWLAGAGTVLLALVLYVVTVHFGTPGDGVYVPPRYENGRVIPSHIEKRRAP